MLSHHVSDIRAYFGTLDPTVVADALVNSKPESLARFTYDDLLQSSRPMVAVLSAFATDPETLDFILYFVKKPTLPALFRAYVAQNVRVGSGRQGIPLRGFIGAVTAAAATLRVLAVADSIPVAQLDDIAKRLVNDNVRSYVIYR